MSNKDELKLRMQNNNLINIDLKTAQFPNCSVNKIKKKFNYSWSSMYTFLIKLYPYPKRFGFNSSSERRRIIN